LPPEAVERVMEILRERLPALHERLSSLRERNPRMFERAMRRLMPFLREYMALRGQDHVLAETIIEEIRAEDRLRSLAREYKAAKEDAAKREEISKQIETLVRRQFEMRKRRHAARLEDFANRIREQQDELARRRAEFDRMGAMEGEMIRRRIENIKRGRIVEDRPGPPGRRRASPRGPGPDGRPGGPPAGPFPGEPPHEPDEPPPP